MVLTSGRQIRRRDFVTLLGSAADRRAQQSDQMRRMLMGYAESDLEAQAWVTAFVQLAELCRPPRKMSASGARPDADSQNGANDQPDMRRVTLHPATSSRSFGAKSEYEVGPFD